MDVARINSMCVYVCVCVIVVHLCLPSWQIFLIFIAFAHKWNCLKSICRFYYYSCNGDSCAFLSLSVPSLFLSFLSTVSTSILIAGWCCCLWHANAKSKNNLFPFFVADICCSWCSWGILQFCVLISLVFSLGFFLRIPFGFITCQGKGGGSQCESLLLLCLNSFSLFGQNMQTFCPHVRIFLPFLACLSCHFLVLLSPVLLCLFPSRSLSLLSIHFWHISCALSVVCPCHFWVQLKHNLCSSTFLRVLCTDFCPLNADFNCAQYLHF